MKSYLKKENLIWFLNNSLIFLFSDEDNKNITECKELISTIFKEIVDTDMKMLRDYFDTYNITMIKQNKMDTIECLEYLLQQICYKYNKLTNDIVSNMIRVWSEAIEFGNLKFKKDTVYTLLIKY